MFRTVAYIVLVCPIIGSRVPVETVEGGEPPGAERGGGMSSRTALNEPHCGVVERLAVPAELHARPDGAPYATFGSVVPIHCCTPEQVSEYANKTHHYCDVFTEHTLAPVGELAYVRLDADTVEKVFINRAKRILLVSSDGQLAQWRAAPSFESHNQYVAGAPVVDASGALVSVVTARRGNHYAVSTFDGAGGYFETPVPWAVVATPEGALVYGDRTFSSRDELRAHIAALPPAELGPGREGTPVMHAAAGGRARIVLVAPGGRQVAHHYLQGVLADDVQYL